MRKQRAKVILNGIWYVEQDGILFYVYHQYRDEDGAKHKVKKTTTGCLSDALTYITSNWWK